MYIIKNTVNTIVLTFTEKATENDSEFIIKFENDVTGEIKTLAVEDISEFTERYNEFLITEATTDDLDNGQINLSPTGQWSYTAYEMAQASPRSRDYAQALAEVESGKVEVYDPNENQINNFEVDDTKNNGVFDE